MASAGASCASLIGLGWIPPLAVTLVVAGIVGSYAIAVARGDVAALFPFISDSGNYPPESCVLAQFFNMAAAVSVVVYYVRYKLLAAHFDSHGANRHLKRTNAVALLLGLISAFGITLVGNFQWYAVPVVHSIGAISGIGVGIVYSWVDAILSLFAIRSRPSGAPATSHDRSPLSIGWCVVVVRFALSAIQTALFVVYMITQVSATQKFDGSNELLWGPSNGGYAEHVTSSGSQWGAVGALLLYVLTYTVEFSRVRWTADVVDAKSTDDTTDKGLSKTQGIVHSTSCHGVNHPPMQTAACCHHVTGPPSDFAYGRYGGYVSRYSVVASPGVAWR